MPVGDPQFNRQQDQSNASLISLGGGGVRANNYLLDGVPITELTGRAVLNPSIEALDEVKVQVHTYDADMGRTGGGVFNTTAKSGTNEFHGTAFFQTRPVWGQSENYFNQVAGLSIGRRYVRECRCLRSRVARQIDAGLAPGIVGEARTVERDTGVGRCVAIRHAELSHRSVDRGACKSGDRDAGTATGRTAGITASAVASA
jgi:hypothetical protein